MEEGRDYGVGWVPSSRPTGKEPKLLTSLKSAMKKRAPKEYHAMVDEGFPRFSEDDTHHIQTLINILESHKSFLDFMRKETAFYPQFMKEAKALGLKDGFDEPGQKFSFKIQETPNVEAEGYGPFSQIMRKFPVVRDFDLFYGNKNHLESLRETKEDMADGYHSPFRLIVGPRKDSFVRHYIGLSILEARIGAPKLFKRIHEMQNKGETAKAYEAAIEFLEDRVWKDGIKVDPKTKHFRNRAKEMLFEDIDDMKKRIKTKKKPVKKLPVHSLELELGEKGSLDLLKGTVSMDCSSFHHGFAFTGATAKHVLDPAFLNFKIFHKKGKKREWVGNVYSLVAEVDKKPAIIIDAVQTSPENWFSCASLDVVKAVHGAMTKYAKKNGFNEVYYSKFVSNRHLLTSALSSFREPIVKRVRKLVGFDHLDELGINTWGMMGGREYLETYSTGAVDRSPERYKNTDQEVNLYKL